MLIFICGEPCHMPLKLLTINESDDTAIHHVAALCFIFVNQSVWYERGYACMAVVGFMSVYIRVSLNVSVMRGEHGDKRIAKKISVWRGKSVYGAGGKKREDMESEKDGRRNEKCVALEVNSRALYAVSYVSSPSPQCDFILKRTCVAVFVRCTLFSDSTKNKQH